MAQHGLGSIREQEHAHKTVSHSIIHMDTDKGNRHKPMHILNNTHILSQLKNKAKK